MSSVGNDPQCRLTLILPAWRDLGGEEARLSPLIIPTHPEVALGAERLLLAVCGAVTGCLQQAALTSAQHCYQTGGAEEPPRRWRMGKVIALLLASGCGGQGQGGDLFCLRVAKRPEVLKSPSSSWLGFPDKNLGGFLKGIESLEGM